MYKKIEIWILYLTVLLGILFAVGFGVLVRQELMGSIKLGWVSKSALFLAEMPVKVKVLLGKGNSVTDRFPLLDGFEGEGNEYESYLLLSRYDGDLKEGVVDLVDLQTFEVLHTWNPDIDAINDLVRENDEFKHLARDNNNRREVFMHPLLLDDGELVFKRDSPLRKIDACSNLIFQNDEDMFHHSLEKDSEGNIWAPAYLYPQTLPAREIGRQIPMEGGYMDDAIVKLAPSGEILYQKSISQILIDNGMEARLSMIGDHGFDSDPIHVNDIQPVEFDGEFWEKGDLFLSLGHQSLVLLYRPSTNEIVWKTTEQIFHQHDIDILDNHRISIFNNNRRYFFDGADVVDGNNEILIYNFETDEYLTYLSDALAREDVRTISEGLSQILPNGDLFLEETNYGRTILFRKDGSVKWAHVNRASDGNVYGVAWSRLLYEDSDLAVVNSTLSSKEVCGE